MGIKSSSACDFPLNGSDCDDNDPTVYSGAPEIFGDGKDNDCNGVQDEGTDQCAAEETEDPIDVYSGAYKYTESDIGYPVPSLTRVIRTYNATVTAIGPFGRGTGMNYEERLEDFGEGKVVYSGGQGLKLAFPIEEVFSGLQYMKGSTASLSPRRLDLPDGSAKLFDEYSRLIQFIDRNGNSVYINRDGQGNITSISDTFGRNLNVQVTTVTANGKDYPVIDRITDDMGNYVEYGYVGEYLSSVSWHDASDPSAVRTVSYEYAQSPYTGDLVKRLSQITDPEGNVKTINTYDSRGRVITQSHEDGVQADLVYTENNGLVNSTEVTSATYPPITTKYEFDDKGYPIQITRSDDSNPSGFTSSVVRDPDSKQVLSMTDSLNETINLTYDQNGFLNSIISPAGNKWSFEYGQYPTVKKPTKIKRPNPFNDEAVLSYDTKSNLTSVQGPGDSAPTTFSYDGRGLLTSATDQAGVTIFLGHDEHGMLNSIAHEKLGVLATYEYNGIGRPTRMTGADGNSMRYDYYRLGTMINTTDSMGRVTTYEYDYNGNFISVIDSKQHAVTFSYNSRENLEQMQDQLSNGDSYIYNGAGVPMHTDRPYKIVDRNGDETIFSYGNVDRYMRADYINDGTFFEIFLDAGARPYIINSSSGAIELTYTDPSTDKVADMIKSFSSPEGMVSYTFDELGRWTSMTAGSQPTVHYTYTQAGLVNSIWLDNSTYGHLEFVYSYDTAGRIAGLSYPNGVTATYSLNEVGGLDGIEYKDSSDSVLESMNYTYDESGFIASVFRQGIETRLDNEAKGAYNDANRPTDFNDNSLEHDNNGNLTRWGEAVFSWNQLGQLTSMTNTPDGNSLDASFSYDALGRRISKIVDGVTTTYLYDGPDIVQMDSDGLTYFFVQGPSMDEPLAMIGSDGSIRYFHEDILGSVIALTDENGAVKTRYNYSPFGKTEVTGEASPNPFQFTGRENDGATGLYYYRARYYSPQMRRFISEDPMGYAAGDVNFYRYVGNSPGNMNDPLGLSPNGPSGPHKGLWGFNTRWGYGHNASLKRGDYADWIRDFGGRLRAMQWYKERGEDDPGHERRIGQMCSELRKMLRRPCRPSDMSIDLYMVLFDMYHDQCSGKIKEPETETLFADIPINEKVKEYLSFMRAWNQVMSPGGIPITPIIEMPITGPSGPVFVPEVPVLSPAGVYLY